MTPEQNNIFEFFLRSDNVRGNTDVPQLSAPASLTPTVVSDTEIDLVWTGVINATNYILERAEQSDYSDAIEIYSGSLASFNDTGLSGGTTYYYRVKAHAAGYTDSEWTEASAMTDASSVTSNLVFADRANMNNTAQELTSTGGGDFGAIAADAIFLDTDENGRIYSDINSLANNYNLLAFDDSPTKQAWTHYRSSTGIAGDGQIYLYFFGTFVPTTIFPTLPVKLGIFKVGGLRKPQYSTDGGTTWNDLLVFRGNFYYPYTGPQYPQLCIYQPGNGLCSQPKITKYSPGPIAKLYLSNGNSIAWGYMPDTSMSINNIGQQGWVYINSDSDWFLDVGAVNGQNIANAIFAFPTTSAPLMTDGFSKIIVSYLEGTNQLVTTSAAASFTLLQTYIAMVLAASPNACALIYCTPTADPAVGWSNAKRLEFNGYILGLTQTSRLKVVDLSGVSELNDALAYQNVTYYQADGIHLTQAGYDLLGAVGKLVLATF